MLRVRDSLEPKNADSATGKRQKRAQWANANGKTPGVTAQTAMRRNVQAKSRPGAQRVGVKGSLASAPREELIISTLGEAGKDISPGWNSRPLDKQGERGEATLGVRVTSAAARSNGKMTKQAGHLNDTSVNLILCVDLAGPRDAQIAGKTLFLGVRVRCVQKRLALDPAGG